MFFVAVALLSKVKRKTFAIWGKIKGLQFYGKKRSTPFTV